MTAQPEVLSRDRVFDGRKVSLEVHRIRDTAGREAEREVVLHGGSVAVLAFPEPGKVLLERNWRYPIAAEVLELPAGTLEAGEDPAACAARELAEETGYRAGRVDPLLTIHPSPGILLERLTIFFAHDVEPGEPDREPGEQIENRVVRLEEAFEMIRDGRITDAKTVAGLLYWDRFVRESA
jgi:ADP-ribose pyrophosphatase